MQHTATSNEWQQKANDIRLSGRLSLNPPSDRRIRLEIATVGRACFGTDTGERKNQIANALSQCSKTLNQLRTQLSALSSDAWAFATEEDELKLLDQLDNLHRRLESGTQYARMIAKDTAESLGGPTRDGRICAFVTAMAEVYKEHYGTKPTHHTRQAEDGYKSAFDEFVQSAYSALHSELGPPKWDALNRAIGEALKMEFWKEGDKFQ